MPSVAAEVIAVSSETRDIKRFILKPQDQGLCTWEAGAHLRVVVSDGSTRAYSLLRLPDLSDDQIALGVLLEAKSAGGSKFMHALKPGDMVKVSDAANQFPLGGHEEHAVLIAGGIGVTPILSMASDLVAADRSFEMHYAGRTEGALSFVPELKAICGDALHIHYDDQPSAMNIQAILENTPTGSHVYFCGPSGMIEAVKRTAKELGWSDERIHFELFATAADESQNTAFDIEVSDTGQIIHVPADKSIIEALEEAGLDPLYDCQRGDCGICQCDVIEGIPDHRDVILSDAEKASNTVMQICVSRSKTPKLVLDL
ncbi:oxidoreductase FAD-binding domain/oxidoreductase NAD-binding domain/2Fe-2S iron-sulfur cluster binding domain protein (plasmid) [Ruegeria pomeroyi DSS-3]|uniref:Oxidoreductase FAD-binding domain/oxidoreductase NAD-binding domain/2Fe-2S iron-sulfur cluster binding domain protein n=2 Tax=Ruegeria pomeroyi TaxID=89184 RepID=Q5LL93_RUEPO|nr:PDR/VanB family oxidoreductase [Ruegeria pomeroyi]AAV97270.1 oxidoreductase FAD-binding domain/oxidoreductase NAD-binding domain/2Fe-2S iron-sulfur cluster binding domain protein [Ruegeria pomeroyi DSS-3]NVK98158.1 oxidoreductase [Ruegeria pomeroyi]NVL03291.1 oxidoreductase [Ruegeria pomeroyi]HCE72873.1 oxidoreductase [Ruegeria sp.]